MSLMEYEVILNAEKRGYEKGVRDALTKLKFEEAVACEFPNPYTAVVANGPLKDLFDLRRKKLLEEK